MRVCLIIDGGYLYHIQKLLGYIDISKLKELVTASLGKIEKGYYVTSIIENQNYLTWLQTGGNIEVVNKSQKEKNCPKCWNPITVEKGVDVWISTAIIKGAYDNKYDTFALVNGDADLIDAIKCVRELGKKVISIGESNSMSNEVLANVDDFINLASYIDGISKQ